MKILFALALIPTVSLAAPSGQQVCRDKTKNIEVSYGTYALGYDGATLKVNGVDYRMSANPGEGFGDVYELLIPFCPCPPVAGGNVGEAKWDVLEGEYNTAKSIRLSLEMVNGLSLKDAKLDCETTEYKAGNEQD